MGITTEYEVCKKQSQKFLELITNYILKQIGNAL